MWLLAILALAWPPSARYVAVAPAESVWVEVAGQGDAVVLVPGLAASACSYRHVASRLRVDGYRTVVIEPLGIGRSSRPGRADYSLTAQSDRIAAVLDTLGESGVVLVAHSISASMALRLAYRRADLVRAVVTLDGDAAESAATPSLRRALRFAPLLRLLGGRGKVRSELASSLRECSGDASWVTDSVVDCYTGPIVADVGRALGAFRAMARAREPQRLADNLHLIRIPVLLIHGGAPGKQTGIRLPQIEALRSHLPQLAVETLPGVGHYVHEEQPDAVAAAIERIARVAGR